MATITKSMFHDLYGGSWAKFFEQYGDIDHDALKRAHTYANELVDTGGYEPKAVWFDSLTAWPALISVDENGLPSAYDELVRLVEDDNVSSFREVDYCEIERRLIAHSRCGVPMLWDESHYMKGKQHVRR